MRLELLWHQCRCGSNIGPFNNLLIYSLSFDLIQFPACVLVKATRNSVDKAMFSLIEDILIEVIWLCGISRVRMC